MSCFQGSIGLHCNGIAYLMTQKKCLLDSKLSSFHGSEAWVINGCHFSFLRKDKVTNYCICVFTIYALYGCVASNQLMQV